MHITFYHTPLCPRCRAARRHLQRLSRKRPAMTVVEVDALLHPYLTLRRGVRMIPALEKQGRILSGFQLGEARIEEFIDT